MAGRFCSTCSTGQPRPAKRTTSPEPRVLLTRTSHSLSRTPGKCAEISRSIMAFAGKRSIFQIRSSHLPRPLIVLLLAIPDFLPTGRCQIRTKNSSLASALPGTSVATASPLSARAGAFFMRGRTCLPRWELSRRTASSSSLLRPVRPLVRSQPIRMCCL